MKKENMSILGMSCASCASGIEKAISKIQGVEKVSINFATEKMDLIYDDSKINIENIVSEIEKMGYKVNKEKFNLDKDKLQHKAELNNLFKKFVVASIFTIPLFIIAMLPMISDFQRFIPAIIQPDLQPLNYALIQILLTIPVIFAGNKFYTVGFKYIFKGKPNMDSLIAIGTSSALIYSIYSTYKIIQGDLHFVHYLYFETVGVIITLILLGKFLESISKGKTSEAIKKLMGLSPKTAILIYEDKEMEVPIEQVKENDILLVKPGAKVPVDGEIIFGTSTIDESMLTGESIPVSKEVGDKVFASSLNKTGMFKLKATKVGEDTAFAQIIKMVEQAQNQKAPIAKIADTVSGYFVPIVCLIAFVSACLWFIFTANLGFSLNIFISVLVIACPCALGLATPTAIMVATGKGAENSILIKSGEALETAHKIDTIIFDKTGTITEGKPKLTEVLIFDDFDKSKFISIIASLEKVSEHPLADAVVNYAKENNIPFLEIKNFNSITGKGIEGEVENFKVFAGNHKFMQERNISIDFVQDDIEKLTNEGKTPIYVVINNKLSGAVFITDTIKESSVDAIKRLKNMGIEIFMITGDNYHTAQAIAKQVGIENVLAEVLPKDKANNVLKLQEQGKNVAMVGDGINDAPALAQANVGIAIGSGTDVAIESADIILVRSNLQDVCTAINLSRKTINNIKQNLFWAFAYNVLGIPVACGLLVFFGGPLLNPMFAAAAMSLSSISVLLNALRLKNVK